MNKQIKEIAEILKNSTTESIKYFQAEVKKAFRNGAKNLKRNDCEKSIHDIAAEALYNAGYRKVSDSEAELQELNIKYYNEAKDLRRQLANIEAENEKRLKASEDFATKHCRMKCEIAKMRVKEFAINLKKVIHEKDYVQGYAEIGLIEEIDELLKEYENE